MSLELLKTLFDVPSKEKTSDSLREYLYSVDFYENNDRYKGKKARGNMIVFDKDYPTLCYQKRTIDWYTPSIEIDEEYKKNKRIVY